MITVGLEGHRRAQARALPSQTSLRSPSSSSYSHASFWEHPSRWNNQSVPISTSSAGSHSPSPHRNGSPLPLNPVHLFPGAPPVVYLVDDLDHLQSEGKAPKARDHGILISSLWHLQCCCCLVAESCPTLCDPMDCSPPGSSVHGILQSRILEWVAISFSRVPS